MPLPLPILDDRNFEQLLEEAKRRIPSFTPEWTNFGIESDPGLTIVQLFAFLTESLLYRANRIPDLNRSKFLQLLGIQIQPASSADGIIHIQNERASLASLPLNGGVVVSAGNVDFLTRDAVNVLPLEAIVYYKRSIGSKDSRYEAFKKSYVALQAAKQAAEAEEDTAETGASGSPAAGESSDLIFYETLPMPLPTPNNPTPSLDLASEPSDRSIYLALLTPANAVGQNDKIRVAIANQILSIGVVPALDGEVPPLLPQRPAARPAPTSHLIYEIPNVQLGPPVANYNRLTPLQAPDVLNAIGIVQVRLPGVDSLQKWEFTDPLDEGTGDFPPRLEDQTIARRLITWIRLRLPATSDKSVSAAPANAKLTWVGINATRVYQAVPVVNELLGTGSGEPDQVVTLANTPVRPESIRVIVQGANTTGELWRLTDDLLSAGVEEKVFTLDPESGQICFGDGLHGARPQPSERLLASYEYGGGAQGNVGIGAIKASRDNRLQGGYKIENPVPTSGGNRGETVAQAERRIPQVPRHRDRLVTQEDFHDIALRTPGVDIGRAEVLPLFAPGPPPDDSAFGVVTVMVIPQFDPLDPLWPKPDRLFLQRVCDYLDPRRLVTTEIYVRGPDYVPVYISVGLQVQGGYFQDLVRQTVHDRLHGYLSSLPPGGPEGMGWPLKKRLIKKDLEAVVTRVPGVEFVDSLELGVGSAVDSPYQDLTDLQLPKLMGLNVTVGTAEPLALVFGAAGAQPAPGKPPAPTPVPVSKATC